MHIFDNGDSYIREERNPILSFSFQTGYFDSPFGKISKSGNSGDCGGSFIIKRFPVDTHSSKWNNIPMWCHQLPS